jgi:2-iminobutanoate/2-iminopropanoate deaminase
VVGGGPRSNLEIEGIGHHDPIPLANKQGNMLYSSGISGMNPSTGSMPEGPERQAAQALQNAARVMELAGSSSRSIAQVTALVGDNSYRPAVMNAWREFFPSIEDQPALHLLNLGVPGRDTQVQLNIVGVL